MPVVEITRDAKVISDEVVTSLVEALPPLVVQALRTPQAPITVKDVDIRVRTPGRFEVTVFDLQIIVSASYSDARNENLADRHGQLMEAVKKQGVLPAGVKAYVWLTLPPAKFGEFTV